MVARSRRLPHSLVINSQAELGTLTDGHGHKKEEEKAAGAGSEGDHKSEHKEVVAVKDKDKDKDGPARTPFQETVFSLMEEIKRKLAPREQRYLADEFSFFDQVTAISGILKVSRSSPSLLSPAWLVTLFAIPAVHAASAEARPARPHRRGAEEDPRAAPGLPAH
jgi:hypothetical protein